jgi:hypothetical protein
MMEIVFAVLAFLFVILQFLNYLETRKRCKKESNWYDVSIKGHELTNKKHQDDIGVLKASSIEERKKWYKTQLEHSILDKEYGIKKLKEMQD